jgi:hypothetical protein
MSDVILLAIATCLFWLVVILGGIYEQFKKLNKNFELPPLKADQAGAPEPKWRK